MTDQEEVSVEQAWEDIKRRCDAAGIEYAETESVGNSLHDSGKVNPHNVLRMVNIRAGSSIRNVLLPEDRIKQFRDIAFESYVFLEDYSAVWNRITNVIETRIISLGPYASLIRLLTRLPGFENLSTTPVSDGSEVRFSPPPDNWRVCATNKAISVELSPLSDEFRCLISEGVNVLPTATSLKIKGASCQNYDRALQALEDIGNAFAFELDVRNNIQLGLLRRPALSSRARPPVSAMPIRVPLMTYPREPVELYQYGRSAIGLPLLQFLAYYQVAEFFFPVYSRQEVARRLRLALKQPRFDLSDDVAVNRLLSVILPEGRTGVGEREQLRLTIRGCMEPDMIREFVQSSSQVSQYFTEKKQAVRGANRILLYDGQPDLRDQVAERIYAIRCRVVHTKQEGGSDAAVDLLLPSSPEARAMAPDVELMRLVAQHVIAAAGVPIRK